MCTLFATCFILKFPSYLIRSLQEKSIPFSTYKLEHTKHSHLTQSIVCVPHSNRERNNFDNMMIRVTIIFALLSVIWLCSARMQFITFYTGTSFTGDSLTIQSHHPNTPYFMEFMKNVRSIRALGLWVFPIPNTQQKFKLKENILLSWQISHGINYTGGGPIISEGLVESRIPNITFPHPTSSVRYVGTLDMSIPAIWLYSNFYLWMFSTDNNQERIVTTPAANDFSFLPRSLVTTGFTNWTTFTGRNFDGVSTCLISTREIEVYHSVNLTAYSIGSVIRGCLGRIDNYVYGGDDIDVSEIKSAIRNRFGVWCTNSSTRDVLLNVP